MARKFPFDKRKRLGSLSELAVPAAQRESVAPEDPITENQGVRLQFRATEISVRVTRVVEPSRSYEGRILGFPNTPVTEFGELIVGQIVEFEHDDIWNVDR